MAAVPRYWAAMAAYCTAADVIAQADLATSTGNRGLIAAQAVDEATAWIDRHCGRSFNKQAEAREFGPASRGLRFVRTGDIAQITGLRTRPDRKSAWTAVSSGDFALDRRVEQLSDDPEHPAQGVMVYADVAPFPWRPYPETTVEVTATFGWPDVPAPVRRAAIAIAARFVVFMARPGFQAGAFNPADALGTPSGSVSEAARMLAPYRRVGVG